MDENDGVTLINVDIPAIDHRRTLFTAPSSCEEPSGFCPYILAIDSVAISVMTLSFDATFTLSSLLALEMEIGARPEGPAPTLVLLGDDSEPTIIREVHLL